MKSLPWPIHRRYAAFLCIAALLLFALPASARDAAAGSRVEVIEDTLPTLDPGGTRFNRFRDSRPDDDFGRLWVLLSRARYWQQDGHLEIILRLSPPEGVSLEETSLEVRLVESGNERTSILQLDAPPGRQLALYPDFPGELLGEAKLEIEWRHGDTALAVERRPFRVERFEPRAAESGRIRLTIPNPDGIRAGRFPVTTGVPFPRGILRDPGSLRLVDEDGRRLPLQVRETARWSKFGTLKWVLCDFAVDLEGGPRELFLEYGRPPVDETRHAGGGDRAAAGSRPGDPLRVELTDGFPRIEAGRMRVEDGLWFDPRGDGRFEPVLDARALSGAFVEHEDGRVYRAPIEDRFEIETQGPEQVVIRREGWYREDGPDAREFCIYITRYAFHRDSPLVRIIHTWVFTGDGNRDRIRNMGWAFPLAAGFKHGGFLTAFGEDGEWARDASLLQWDFDHFDLIEDGEVRTLAGGRAPGVAAVEGGDVRLYLGIRDFWQNYPSELEFKDGTLWFHNWPRQNRAASRAFDLPWLEETGRIPRASAARRADYEDDGLGVLEWTLNALQVRFAHEGELLNFRLPDRFAEDPFYRAMTLNWPRAATWKRGDVEHATNAQGVARTEEMWIYLASAPADGEDEAERENAAGLFEGLNEYRLHAVADPAWMAASGAFFEIHPRDPDRFPEAERAFELAALSYGRMIERLGVYGMWIYGDVPAWRPRLTQRTAQVYRAYRKAHQGWPYSWKPYARSGDPALLKFADIATRRMIDTSHTHYADERVASLAGAPRRIGRHGISIVGWAGTSDTAETRNLYAKTDWLWHAYYLTGYARARDVALEMARQTRIEEPMTGRGAFWIDGDRHTVTLFKTFVDMYEATFDPWYLAAMHIMADGLRYVGETPRGRRIYAHRARVWDTGEREFHRFTGCRNYERFLLNYVASLSHERRERWMDMPSVSMPLQAYAWKLTGDTFFLRRIAAAVDFVSAFVKDGGEPEYLVGTPLNRGEGNVAYTSYTSFLLPFFGSGLWALGEADEPVESLQGYLSTGPTAVHNDVSATVVVVEKNEGEAVPLILQGHVQAGQHARADDERLRYEVIAPDGGIVAAGEFPVEETDQLFTAGAHPYGEFLWPRMTVFEEIPADAPPGLYRVAVTYHDIGWPRVRVLHLPVSGRGHREVIQLAPGRALPEFSDEGALWFHVPEGLEAFDISFPASAVTPAVWGPDGRRVWSLGLAGDMEFPGTVRVPVEPHQAGRLWRITHAPSGTNMDPRIPPVYAVERERFFLPGF